MQKIRQMTGLGMLATTGLLVVWLGFRDLWSSQASVGTSPDFTLRNLDGETVSMADFRGTPMIVAFASANLLSDQTVRVANVYVRERHPEIGIVTVGTSWERAEDVPEVYRRLGHDFLLGTPEDRARWSDGGHPTLFFVGADGVIRHEWTGVTYIPVMQRLGAYL